MQFFGGNNSAMVADGEKADFALPCDSPLDRPFNRPRVESENLQSEFENGRSSLSSW